MKFFYKFIKIAVFILCCCNLFASQEKIYKIATDIDFPPFEFRDINGELKGIDIELLEAISKDQNFKFELLEMGFQGSLEALDKGKVDAIFSAMTITDERLEKYDFSTPYFSTGISLAVNKDSSIDSYDDLKGKTVSVKRGTIGSQFAENLAKQYNFHILYLEDSLNLVNDVATNMAEACFEDTAFLKYSIATGSNIKLPTKEENIFKCAVMFRKGENKELLEKINTGLKNIKKNGEFDRIINKYLTVRINNK